MTRKVPPRRKTPARRRPVRTPPRKPQRSSATQASLDLALGIARAGLDKKALAVEIIDVSGKVDYADFLVLMSATSDRHVAAVAESVSQTLKHQGHRALSVEGSSSARWVLIDFVDVVAHVFLAEARAVYDIDGLWMDAARIPVVERAR